MAQGNQGNGGGSHFFKWLRKNYLFKMIVYFVMFILTFVLFISIFSNATHTINIIQYYNGFNYKFSKELNNMPVYSSYANYFKAYYYYENYSYPINQGFYEKKFWLFWFMFILETLPFFIVYFLFLPNFIKVKDSFFEYEKQLKWRSMKPEPDPIGEMKKAIFSEGTYGEPSDTYSTSEVESMKEMYQERKVFDSYKVDGLYGVYKSKLKNNLLLHCKTLKELHSKYNNKEDWDKFFKKMINENKNLNNFLFIPNLNGYEWEEEKTQERKIELFEIYKWDSNFKFVQELKIFVSKELYIPSINKEIEAETLLEYYNHVLVFWMTKQTKNFPMFDFTININMPIEFKVMSKWTSGRNAPGLINVPVNPNVPRRESKTRTSDIYFRMYHFKEYIGIESDYMLLFLDRINKKLD